jgi:hypothetical protein
MHYLLILWLAALCLLMLRLVHLRLHHSYPLFTMSTGFDIIFGAAAVHIGINAAGMANVGLLGDTMDVFLTPFIALELFSSKTDREGTPARFIGPALVTLGAAAAVVVFLMNSPDADSLEVAEGLAFLMDTVMTVVVIWYALRKSFRPSTVPGRNLLWLRRLFIIELVSSALRNLVAPLFANAHLTLLDIAFILVSVIATAVCTLALRKKNDPSVPA